MLHKAIPSKKSHRNKKKYLQCLPDSNNKTNKTFFLANANAGNRIAIIQNNNTNNVNVKLIQMYYVRDRLLQICN